MVDNLLFFNKAKMKLHGTEAIKFLFLIAHLDEESTFSLLGKKCQSQLSQIIVKSRQLKSNWKTISVFTICKKNKADLMIAGNSTELALMKEASIVYILGTHTTVY